MKGVTYDAGALLAAERNHRRMWALHAGFLAGRAVGRLASRSRYDDVVDLVVVEGALRRGDAVVTSDVDDLRDIAAALGDKLTLESV